MKFILVKLAGVFLLLCTLCDSSSSYETYDKTRTSSPTINIDNIYACPRCRRNQPKGPKKKPTPPGSRIRSADYYLA